MPTQRRTAKSARKASAKSAAAAKKSSKRPAAKSTSSTRNAARKTARGSSRSTSAGASATRGASTKRSTGARKSATRRAPDALEILMADHRSVQKLFRKAQRLDAGDAQLADIIETACTALTEHTELEESLFYPALRAQANADDMLDEAQVEHDVAKQLIAQLEGASGTDEQTKAMFKVLGEYVNHHIEEEEGQMFRAAKRAKIDLAALGEQLMAAKRGGTGMKAASDEPTRRSSADGDDRRARRSTTAREDTDTEAGSGNDEGERSYDGRGRVSADEAGDTGSAGDSRASADSEADEEIDVETPGGRSGGRSSSHPTSH
jgi:hemerythrin superfamily protein